MKKILLSMMLCAPMALAAQNGVTVSNFAGSTGEVTFNVSWNKDNMPAALWSDTVWVFVDYNNAGRMERLPLRSGAMLTATSAPGVAKVMEVPGNDQGVWVVGNAHSAGSFSATVKLLVAVADFNGACAYASNYQPVGRYLSATNVSFTGTSIYKITLKETGGAGTLTEYSDGTYTIRAGYGIQSFTDATSAPGTFHCAMPATQTLVASAEGYCEGSTVVQFALQGTQSGVTYQLYRDNAPLVTLNGTGSAATFACEIRTPSAAGAAPDPLCCCACGLSSIDNVCQQGSPTGMVVPPYHTCVADVENTWDRTCAYLLCLYTKDCTDLIVYAYSDGRNWWYRCNDETCSVVSPYMSLPVADRQNGRCWDH
jgi:hypothetical protein